MENKEKSFAERVAETRALMAEMRQRSAVSMQKVQQLDEEGQRERKQFDRDMHDIARGKKPEEQKKGIPNLQERIAATRLLLKRSKELGESQQRLVEEMAANPLEQQIDAVYADMGQKLYALDQEEIDDAVEADRFLEADEQSEHADEELERSGQPPPLRQVK